MASKWTAREIQQLRALVRRAEPEVRRIFLRAVQHAKASIPASNMAARVAAGDIEGALAIVDWDRLSTARLRNELAAQLRTVYEGAGQITVARWAMRGMGFTITDERPLRWLREHAAQRVVEALPDQRDAMRIALTEGYRLGYGANRLARLVREETPGTFLHGAWREAVARLRDELTLEGYSQTRVASEVGRYQQQLVNARSLAIARTEVTSAASAGRLEGWEQAIEAGLVEREQLQVSWLPAADGGTGNSPCEICETFGDLPARAPGEAFGVDVFGIPCHAPPAHPNCRCDLVSEVRT